MSFAARVRQLAGNVCRLDLLLLLIGRAHSDSRRRVPQIMLLLELLDHKVMTNLHNLMLGVRKQLAKPGGVGSRELQLFIRCIDADGRVKHTAAEVKFGDHVKTDIFEGQVFRLLVDQ